MAKRERLGLTAVRTEGAILPASILQRIHREDLALDGLKPEQYGLAGDRLREAASRAWNALQGPWTNFKAERAKLAPVEAGTSITRNRWLNPILRELHFGPVEAARESLKFEDKEFPVSHLYGHAPLHLIGCNLDLDKRTPGAVGAARMSPHGLLQSCLNARKENLWGYVTNGLRWRVLRDDNSLSRQSMVEFDLEAIFEGQLYDEFLLFFLVCHRSRLESGVPEECWLERWSQAAGEEGKRALDTLRDGVQKSIEALGQGFLRHPANNTLRERVRNGELDKQDYYRQLLRMVYRFLFLFVAEDRGLLLDPKGSEFAKALYVDEFSTQRLRMLAERMRGSSRHHDLFSPVKLILAKLGHPQGCPQLALPALGGFLFSDTTAPDLDASEIANCDLLEAIRYLALTREGGRLARVDYKNLGTEELGSVYESLLELHPDLASDGTWFELKSASGNERKTSGSYYTPDSLIQCLLDTALDPVVEAAIKRVGREADGRENAILDLRIIDPAVGSGHFLIAAAHRLAKRLAQVRTLEDEPSPDATRHALRDVVGRCVYGIDLNPMAAELCKVSLWIEALEPGRPLSFLDHHIVVGNSLLGTTPEQVGRGIPDEAFDPIGCDDRELCKRLKKLNKDQKKVIAGKLTDDLFGPIAFAGKELLKAWEELEALPDITLEDVEKKDVTYRRAEAAVVARKVMADAWCAAFFLTKTGPIPGDSASGQAITTATLGRLANGEALTVAEQLAVEAVASEFSLLHPHVAFPGVFSSGGFDVVLGNPPWEKINLKDEEYFVQSHPHIAAARNKSERNILIAELEATDPVAHFSYVQAQRNHDKTSPFLRNSGRYPLTGLSRVNLYSVFTETALLLVRPLGRIGMVLASGIVTDDNNKELFSAMVESRRLVHALDFENRQGIFQGVHRMYKFLLLCIGGSSVTIERPDFAFFLESVSQLGDESRHFSLSPEDLLLLNPATRTCPTFRNSHEAELTKTIYRTVPAWGLHRKTPRWPGNPKTPFNMSNDSGLFTDRTTLLSAGVDAVQYLPLYESKFIFQFNHRFATFSDDADDGAVDSSLRQLEDPSFSIESRYWLPRVLLDQRFPCNWVFGYRMITNASNERTAVSAIIPERPCSHSLSIVQDLDAQGGLLLLACVNSFVFDYAARQKVAGTNFSHWIWHQLPILTAEQTESLALFAGARATCRQWIVPRALELTYVADDLTPFAREVGYDGAPFRWDEGRRSLLRAELDAALFHLYGIARDDVDYIMETFPIVKRKDIAAHGHYRTKEAILSLYDEMAEAIRTTVPYTTRLDPPSARGWSPPPLPSIKPEGESLHAGTLEVHSDQEDSLAGLFAPDQN